MYLRGYKESYDPTLMHEYLYDDWRRRQSQDAVQDVEKRREYASTEEAIEYLRQLRSYRGLSGLEHPVGIQVMASDSFSEENTFLIRHQRRDNQRRRNYSDVPKRDAFVRCCHAEPIIHPLNCQYRRLPRDHARLVRDVREAYYDERKSNQLDERRMVSSSIAIVYGK